jgi:hypothetical protein
MNFLQLHCSQISELQKLMIAGKGRGQRLASKRPAVSRKQVKAAVF